MAAGHGAIDRRADCCRIFRTAAATAVSVGVVAVGQAQATLQVAAGFQVPPQGVAAEQFQRLPRDFRRDERIAVAVAADPSAKADEAADAEGKVAVVPRSRPCEDRGRVAARLAKAFRRHTGCGRPPPERSA